VLIVGRFGQRGDSQLHRTSCVKVAWQDRASAVPAATRWAYCRGPVEGDTVARDDPGFQARVAEYLRRLRPCDHPDQRRRLSQYFEAIHCKALIAMEI
jgi:hypothetical protein